MKFISREQCPKPSIPTAIYDIYKPITDFNKKSLPSLPSNKHTHEHKSLHS